MGIISDEVEIPESSAVDFIEVNVESFSWLTVGGGDGEEASNSTIFELNRLADVPLRKTKRWEHLKVKLLDEK